MLAWSEACERNKEPILRILRQTLAAARRVLEIGSGTGQHAVHFARNCPHLEWQPTDLAASLPELHARIALEGPPNLLPPLELDVRVRPWRVPPADAVFSANTLHIMGRAAVESFFAGAGELLRPGGRLLVYGPFSYGGVHTSPSNAAFDRHLRARDPASGVRDFEAVNALASAAGLALAADHAMPAHNRLIEWHRP